MLRKLGLLALMAGLCLGWAAPARADRLDSKLNEEMPRVVKYLNDKGYKNVGVLRFRAQRGTGKLGFSVGPINSNMVERVENLLILHTGSEKGPSMGITHEAGGAVQNAGVGAWFTNESERKKLFEVDYPLAWGKDSVKVDAFLTGKIVNTGDRKKTTVAIEAFGKTQLKPEMVIEFAFDTDSSMIRDLGDNFALSGVRQQQALEAQQEKKEQVIDDLIISQLALEGEKKEKTPEQGRIAPDDIAGIKFEMLVDGKPTAITENTAGDARYQTPCPNKGQPVVLYLTNTTEKRLGVVLKVGGLSTIDQEIDDSLNCRKWVIPPGKRFTFRGYYHGEKADKYVPFTVLDGEGAKKVISQVGDRAQFIQVDVLRESARGPVKLISARGMKPAVRKLARTSHETLYRQLMQSAGAVRTRGPGGEMVIGPAPIDPKETTPAGVTEFSGPVLIGTMSVRVLPAGYITTTGLDPDDNPRD